jgi:exodeoxyribonuclease VII large subunit
MSYSNIIQKNSSKSQKIFSISEYIDFVNNGLKNYKAKVIGEVSEIKLGPTGHAYFSLKDDKDQSILKCIIWNSKYNLYGIKLEKGLKIIALGSPNLHKQYGFSFIAETIEYAGEGILEKEYNKLRKKLTEEGIFAESRKRFLPKYLQKIGIVTSLKAGVVIADFSNNLGKFGFKVKMIDSRVEGQIATTDLLRSIETFKKQDIEVLVIMRGGGSLESLIAFNNEKLVREVANFPLPVIAAIGHETDIPLLSLAADVMVSTPTAAANLLSKSWEEAQFKMERYERNIINLYSKQLSETDTFLNEFVYKIKDKFGTILNKYKEIENKFKIFIIKIEHTLISKRKDIKDTLKFIFKSFSKNLSDLECKIESIDFYTNFEKVLVIKQRNIVDHSKSILKNFISTLGDIKYKIKNTEKLINSYNPERQIRLGYSITRINGKLIKSIKSVKIGEDIDVQVSDGSIQSKIRNIIK